MPIVLPGDLTPYLNQAVGSTTLILSGDYTLSAATLRANGVRVLGDVRNPARITLLANGVDVLGNDVEFAGLHFESKVNGGGWRKVFEVNGDRFACHDCTADRITTFVKMNGNNAVLTKNTVGTPGGTAVGGDVFYNTGNNNKYIDCSVLGMARPDEEHPYREDVLQDEKGNVVNVPTGNLVQGGTWVSAVGPGTGNKEVFAIRASRNLTIDSPTIDGYLRAGQSAGDNHVTGLALKNLTFVRNLPAMTLIDIKFGVTGTLGPYTLGLPGQPFAQKQTELMVGPNSKINHVPA